MHTTNYTSPQNYKLKTRYQCTLSFTGQTICCQNSKRHWKAKIQVSFYFEFTVLNLGWNFLSIYWEIYNNDIHFCWNIGGGKNSLWKWFSLHSLKCKTTGLFLFFSVIVLNKVFEITLFSMPALFWVLLYLGEVVKGIANLSFLLKTWS